jgi:hypothetical protein
MRLGAESPIPAGAHYTLCYCQLLTGVENISSVTEIIYWIKNGPILQPPTIANPEVTGISPTATIPLATATLQYVPITQRPAAPRTDVRIETIINSEPSQPHPDDNESEIPIEEISNEQLAPTRSPRHEKCAFLPVTFYLKNREERVIFSWQAHGSIENCEISNLAHLSTLLEATITS